MMEPGRFLSVSDCLQRRLDQEALSLVYEEQNDEEVYDCLEWIVSEILESKVISFQTRGSMPSPATRWTGPSTSLTRTRSRTPGPTIPRRRSSFISVHETPTGESILSSRI